jgi:hypothetical protein
LYVQGKPFAPFWGLAGGSGISLLPLGHDAVPLFLPDPHFFFYSKYQLEEIVTSPVISAHRLV